MSNKTESPSAGAKPRKCWVAVIADWTEAGTPYSIGVAVEGESGYHPTNYPGVETWGAAEAWALALNERMGVDSHAQLEIVASTMRREA